MYHLAVGDFQEVSNGGLGRLRQVEQNNVGCCMVFILYRQDCLDCKFLGDKWMNGRE
jgi:hypothetical protein